MLSHTFSFTLFLALIYSCITPYFYQSFYAEACSSRAVPKPRPSTTSSSSSIAATAPPTTTTQRTTTAATTTTTTTARPNITFPTYKCPATYDAWYCLNEATCFSVKIGDSVMYNCECASGFMGPRCEYKELDGSFLPKRPRPMLEKASIASGATLALLFMLFVCLTLYLRYDQKSAKFVSMDVVTNSGSCCYCTKNCCDDSRQQNQQKEDESSNDKWWRRRMAAGVSVFGAVGLARQQHLQTMPMTFAVKRTAKM